MANEETVKPKSRTDRKPRSESGRKPFAQKRRKSFKREKPDFEQKLLGIRRVTRVMAGGRRFSFSVTMVIGDKKGAVGVGLGKSSDTSLAIGKSVKDAQGNKVTIPRTEEKSIPYPVHAKYCSSEVTLVPNHGRGLVAGGAVRDVLNLAGITNVSAKIISRSKNQLNNARATVKALQKIKAISARATTEKEVRSSSKEEN